MKLNTKTLAFQIGMMAFMIAVLVAVSLLSFRQFSLVTAREHTRTAAEIIRVNLTEMMVNGVIQNRESFLRRIKEVEGLKTARVIRGDRVVAQFGRGLDYESAADEVEHHVLESGQPVYEILGERILWGDYNLEFRATIPYVATSVGAVNCLNCHHVEEGTVLGAVTLTTSMSHLRRDALKTVAVIALTIGFFALISVLFFRRMFRPLLQTASEVQHAVERAGEGDFTVVIERRTSDEIGQIADDFNRLTRLLDKKLGHIRDDVAQLMQSLPTGSNLLTTTTDMVEGLVRVAHFKQAIEEDETRMEVYERLSKVIGQDFGIATYSIYEVDNSTNRIIPIFVDGERMEEQCRWCDMDILVRSGSCRATRTGHVIDAVESPHLCNAFSEEAFESGKTHFCIPVIQSGTVGSVVQLVTDRQTGESLQQQAHLVQAYLREMAPVLEAKRLMDTLRESSLRDAMTGLHNRRYLEEYIDTLVSSADRRKVHLTVLMLDLDYFKKVNDTHGHDAGDAILRALADILVQNVRASDLVIRYGGEEFLIILQETAADEAGPVAEKIRASVEDYKFQIPGGVLRKTISIGYADYPGDSTAFWRVLKFADAALYKAKDGGRNQAIRFEPGMWEDGEQY